MQFEWDDRKAQRNLKKHGVDRSLSSRINSASHFCKLLETGYLQNLGHRNWEFPRYPVSHLPTIEVLKRAIEIYK